MKVGDRVTVYRKVKKNYWISYMDQFVGVSGEIINIDEIEKAIAIIPEGIDSFFWFPKNALKYEVKNV